MAYRKRKHFIADEILKMLYGAACTCVDNLRHLAWLVYRHHPAAAAAAAAAAVSVARVLSALQCSDKYSISLSCCAHFFFSFGSSRAEMSAFKCSNF